MKIIVEGTYRSRLRVNLLLFTVAGRWEEKPFRMERQVNGSSVALAALNDKNIPVPVTLDAVKAGGHWNIDLGVAGIPIRLGRVKLNVPKVPFKCSPAKGVEVTGYVSVRD